MADIKTFAADLKAAREEKNLTLKGISQQTRLSVSILENIESGDFTFQPQAYIRAFLKQYINSLDLDMDETLFDYDLARSGKYKPKQSSYSTDDPKDMDIPQEPKSSRTRITEKLKGMVESPKKVQEEKKTENIEVELSEESPEHSVDEPQEDTPVETPPQRNEPVREQRTEQRSEERKEPVQEKKLVQKRPEEKYYTTPGKSREKKKISFSFLNSPVVRNIFMILFIGLVLVGLYSLINILFLEGSSDKPEVIRQNFDDIVKEQEKKILGKRTPEEIQDSIRKADELAAAGDSVTLKVTGLESGIFFLVTDSANYSNPAKISFEKGDIGVFKARDKFYISLENTEAVKVTINDIPLKFDNKSVSKVKISRNGIAK